jgi:hypothetical protein
MDKLQPMSWEEAKDKAAEKLAGKTFVQLQIDPKFSESNLCMLYEKAGEILQELATSREQEAAAKQWIRVEDRQPDIGIEVIGFNEDWANADFNPNGTRLCWINESPLPEGYWVIVKWCNYHDEYHTGYCKNHPFGEEQQYVYPAPTHWQHKPVKPL